MQTESRNLAGHNPGSHSSSTDLFFFFSTALRETCLGYVRALDKPSIEISAVEVKKCGLFGFPNKNPLSEAPLGPYLWSSDVSVT
jgi:hypothetical protein